MIKFIAVCAALAALPVPSTALTYTYEGSPYDSVYYYDEKCDIALKYTCRGSYDVNMRLTMEFSIDGRLGANLIDEQVKSAVYGSDGIASFTSGPLYVSTDDFGTITNWHAHFLYPTGDYADRYIISSDGVKGDSVEYRYEFGYWLDEPLAGFSSEIANASSSRAGTWSVVPLPATFPLMVFGFSSLLAVRGRRLPKNERKIKVLISGGA